MKSNEPDQSNPKSSDAEMLNALQRETFSYFTTDELCRKPNKSG